MPGRKLLDDRAVQLHIDSLNEEIRQATSIAGRQALAAQCRDSSETPAQHISDLYKNLAEIEAKARKYEDAEAHYKSAIQIDPKNTPAYCGLAKCYKRQKKMAEGKAMLKAALAVPGTDRVHKSIIRDWLLDFE